MNGKRPPKNKRIIIDRPEATVLRVVNGECFILCPICLGEHKHQKVTIGEREDRAAACDLWFPVNPLERAHGYQFTPKPEDVR